LRDDSDSDSDGDDGDGDGARALNSKTLDHQLFRNIPQKGGH